MAVKDDDKKEYHMTASEFAYHLNTFMEYMRQMENGMSKNWDNFEKFQTIVRNNSESIIKELAKNERLTDFKAVIDGIKSQLKDGLGQLQRQIDAMTKARKEMYDLKDQIDTTLCAFMRDFREIVKDFKEINPKLVAKKGALEALDVVADFKEAFHYLKTVRAALGSGAIPDFECIPENIRPSVWNLPIEECEFSQRVFNFLRGEKVRTLGDLASLPKRTIFQGRGIGKNSLQEIMKVLEEHGLTIGMKDER